MPEIFDSEDLKKNDSAQESESVAKKTDDSTEKNNKSINSNNKKMDSSEKDDKKAHRHVDQYSEVMRNEQPQDDHISWYIPKPSRMAFSTQNKDEHIILVLRQHPVTQLKWFVVSLGLAFMPLLFSFAGIFDFLPDRFYFAGLLGWYLVVLGYILEAFLKWFYNVYIITDERIIDVDFNSLINRDISSAKIENIEDVTAATAGVLAAVFDYGRVVIQTAAEKREFEFPGIPNPNKVATLIDELILEEEREKIEGRVR